MPTRTSTQNLRKRVRYHYRGNAAGSTLRLTLCCLLGLELRRVGSGNRLTFGKSGEASLSPGRCWRPIRRTTPTSSVANVRMRSTFARSMTSRRRGMYSPR
ncbi:GIY-YIG nuclease family protein [Streptomyces sp. NPDC001848]|uniref:GIY-YIG nuclease family protein n=1 Tax=Streptomyces sp. NPDC001848 TaxID=3364618 RepID=UPI00367E2D24